jgi:hypothetical protein
LIMVCLRLPCVAVFTLAFYRSVLVGYVARVEFSLRWLVLASYVVGHDGFQLCLILEHAAVL